MKENLQNDTHRDQLAEGTCLIQSVHLRNRRSVGVLEAIKQLEGESEGELELQRMVRNLAMTVSNAANIDDDGMSRGEGLLTGGCPFAARTPILRRNWQGSTPAPNELPVSQRDHLARKASLGNRARSTRPVCQH